MRAVHGAHRWAPGIVWKTHVVTASWESATTAQYDDDTNLAARQALFDWLAAATPLPPPLSDMASLAGQRVLDIGCGNGRFLAQAALAGARAFGADFSLGMAGAARETAGAPVLQCDAHSLPFADESIDTVLALWMLYHVDDKAAALREFRRVLTPDGQVVATTNSAVPGELDALVLDALGGQLGERPDQWHAPLDFTSENGESIMRQVFDAVHVHPFGNTFHVARADVLVRYVGSMLGPIGEHHGPIDDRRLLTSVGAAAQAAIDRHGHISIERRGTAFIATA
jgi:SAM-dependent methyltransferase